MDREDEIKQIAFTIWQSEGCCDGHDLENWLRAEMAWEEQQKKASAVATAKKPSQATKTSSKVRPARKQAHHN